MRADTTKHNKPKATEHFCSDTSQTGCQSELETTKTWPPPPKIVVEEPAILTPEVKINQQPVSVKKYVIQAFVGLLLSYYVSSFTYFALWLFLRLPSVVALPSTVVPFVIVCFLLKKNGYLVAGITAGVLLMVFFISSTL